MSNPPTDRLPGTALYYAPNAANERPLKHYSPWTTPRIKHEFVCDCGGDTFRIGRGNHTAVAAKCTKCPAEFQLTAEAINSE